MTYTKRLITIETGATGSQGPAGPQGEEGPAGPNEITASTATAFIGLILGNGSTVEEVSDIIPLFPDMYRFRLTAGDRDTDELWLEKKVGSEWIRKARWW